MDHLEQLSLFEVPTTTVIPSEVSVFTKEIEEPLFKEVIITDKTERSKEVVEEAIIKSIGADRSLAPTWQIDYFDKAKRGRIDWVRAEDEDQAREDLRKKVNDDVLTIVSVSESKYSLEEIELLD
ncbi:hypothetical protein OCB15_18085 [Bacillus cereus]|nr:hypothetical protein [Bacillus cereus]